jgi:hypothetical protein
MATASVKPLIKTIDVNGRTFKKLDFNTEFSVRHFKYIRKIISNIWDVSKMDDLQHFQLLLTKKMIDMEYFSEVMALMYIELNDENRYPYDFTDMQYQRQIDAIDNSTLQVDDYIDEVLECLGFFLRKYIASFQTFSQAMPTQV